MVASVLTVAGNRFQLARDVDISQLIKRIEHAVHAGGQMVSIPVAAAQSVFVLIAHSQSVVLLPSTEAEDLDEHDEIIPVSVGGDTEWDTTEFELGAFF